MCVSFSSCFEKEEVEVTIRGRLVDATHHKDLSQYELYARSIYGTTEKSLNNAKVDKDGNFELTYSIQTGASGNNLRIALMPSIVAQDKFEFLPIGESWYKTFYIGDSASLFIKLSKDIKEDQTLYIRGGGKTILFKGPSTNKSIGMYRVLNKKDTYSYYIDNASTQSYQSYGPSGDPIVDTLTLNINP